MRVLKILAAAILLVASLGCAAFAQTLEKTSVRLGVGGKALLYYLPLTIAEKKGFFKEQGLDVEIDDFAGGAKSLQALVGGSVDAVTGAYDHTIRMQAKGQDIRAVLELGRFPGIVVAVKKGVKYDSPADFKGLKIGVTAPGSSTNIMMNYVLAQAGLTPDDVSFIGVGSASSAVAAIQKGEIQALSHLEPVISMLERSGDIRVVIDTRTEAGTRALFGGENPAAVLYLKKDFIDKNPNTTQALVNALYKALKWIQTASPEEIANTVPEEYLLGDKALYEQAVQNSKASYSITGLIDPAGMKSTNDMLVKFDDTMKDTHVDLSKTFVDTFAKKAAESVK
ncbi:ABC transporter substrate-binding protein [Methylovirgula sp. 4M-Z18]|uniref:ABC transporter substrate-binding protein n=1 Tax=Methylovirgula sp. 4M-Z18 TaxID=2293567 RepID=UPI000E2FAAD8|nr:ABC transporter substrate-binding protein [Methylovirgula sp. 4M-Z18]RFB75042.1 ABC transporter substrate-binding protein [Methylovirgula sp. 4M-Z18]